MATAKKTAKKATKKTAKTAKKVEASTLTRLTGFLMTSSSVVKK